MKYHEYKVFDLKTERPNVLLVGNGILMSCEADKTISDNESLNWIKVIKKLAKDGIKDDVIEQLKDIPYSVLATAVADCEDPIRRKEYIEKITTTKFSNNKLLKSLVKLNFQAILTTNYTYEIEEIFHPNFSELKNKNSYVCTTRKKIKNQTEKEKNTKDIRLVYTYNKFEESPPIWHIHGELRNKSSITLTHDEYSKLMCDIVNHNRITGNAYEFFDENLKFKSWIDYLIMGNVFVVGQGLNFSELDLWLLINRKKRERSNSGKFYYFTPKNKNEKVQKVLNLLNDSGENKFIVSHLDIEISSNENEDYKRFYMEIMKDIEKILKNER